MEFCVEVLFIWAMEGGDHKGYRAGSELFVCFTSRQTSVRLGSKSVLSPGRSEKFRESSSRRLRSNGSKGQSSPMFPILPYNLTGRKKNGSFETQEPSSPKVTCIGQVRVKSKQKKRFHKPKSSEREDCMPHRSHQKWVHLFGFGKEVSFNICEALRSFGAEFNCFVPCGSTASTTSPAPKGSKDSTTCGAVFAKWFMVLQEGDEKKVQARDEAATGQRMTGEGVAGICTEMEDSRPSVKEVHRPSIKELSRPSIKDLVRLSLSEDEARLSEDEFVSVIPPKNALLLMRCRSEPLRTSPLDNNRRCKSEPFTDEEEEHYRSEDESEEEEEDEVYKSEFEGDEEQPTRSSLLIHKETLEAIRSEDEEANIELDDEIEKEILSVMGVANAVLEETEPDTDTEIEKTMAVEAMESASEESCEAEPEDIAEALPNALLLMMGEPKLSLEISKETWVSREDFVRRPIVVKMDACEDDNKENEESRKICNIAADTLTGVTNSMSRVVDENVPPSIVLTRCKSEPLRASVKLVPEACLWKPRNLDIPSFIIRGSLEIGTRQVIH